MNSDDKPTFSSIYQQHKATAVEVTSLAELLKTQRQELKISLSHAQRATKIRSEILTLIEKGDYAHLDDTIYVKGFVKNYADYLGFDSEPILNIYKQERAQFKKDHGTVSDKTKTQIGLKPIHSPRFVITPKTFIILSVVAIFIAVVGYLTWQFIGLASPPSLTLDSPNEQTVDSNFGYISGRVEGGADLFINDSPILSNPDGSFREKIALVDGVNQIKVTAKNKLSKTANVTKIIVAKLPPLPPKPEVAAVPQKFDGVELMIKVTKQASWMIVEADGKEIFRGTMLGGTQQDFKAADRLKLTVGNAGSTQLILTNSQVVSKDLGLLGADGEVKRDLEFKKDTTVL